MIKASGILFLTPDNLALFTHRGNGGDHPNEWAFPGGKQEDGETIEECAIREAFEETGFKADVDHIKLHTRGIAEACPAPAMATGEAKDTLPSGASPVQPTPSEAVDFTTYICRVTESFAVTICDESTGYSWASIDAPPMPLHPGCAVALARLSMDELGVARAMAAGQLVSPQRYENVSLFAMRITGTGVAYRSSLGEFVFRDPLIYLNQEFLDRCAGLAVILEHPDSATLNSEEYINRTIGSIMFAYIKGDEVWGIAKVYDDAAIELMTTRPTSTSPAVVFKNPDVNSKLTLEDGSALLIEGKPSLLDHIAVLPDGAGVWDKGGELAGVDQNGTDVRVDSQTGREKSILDPIKLHRLGQSLQLLDIRMSNYVSQRRR